MTNGPKKRVVARKTINSKKKGKTSSRHRTPSYSMPPESAAKIIQQAFRKYKARKKLNIKVTSVGKGIISTRISMIKPSEIFGDAGIPLDLNKTHEIMVTRVKMSDVSLVLSTNQGTPDALTKHLKDCEASYGAVINGGFYAIDGFYYLGTDRPIGLHRFKYNASIGMKQDSIKRDIDTTDQYFKHAGDDLSKPFDDYLGRGMGIPTQLYLKTQTPSSVQEQYGTFRITKEGCADIQPYANFANNNDFKNYISQAEYLLTSGPVLVKDGQVTLTKEVIKKDPRYHFNFIFDKLGSHPGSVPPGTFYHADQLNPRSAVGFNAKGDLLMVTVKGEEDPSNRDGMSLDQFALLMKLLGAETALNLDGGYSACQGVFNFNNDKMHTPLFIKKHGREKVLPCSIVAKEKTTVSKNYNVKQKEVTRKGMEVTKRKLPLFKE
jgi:hypothetical protein